MERVTLDTNVLPADDLISAAPDGAFDFAIISVTESELGGTSWAVALRALNPISTTIPYGRGRYGAHAYGGVPSKACIEMALSIISNGSFPHPSRRESLTPGERRQHLDALIPCTHVRDNRDILVTDDQRGFIKGGRREHLQEVFRTRIMTRNEFANMLTPTPETRSN